MKPRRFAVIGDPVAHSKSPAMHAAAIRALGLPHTYEAVRVAAEELPRVVAVLREGGYDGLNVTVPHKERVLALVDAVDPSARLAGAANTLVRADDGRVVAHNTDVPALAAELRRLPGTAGRLARMRARSSSARGARRGRPSRRSASARRPRDRGSRARVRRPCPSRRVRRTAPCPVTRALGPFARERSSRRSTVVQATSAGMRGADPGEAVASVVAWDALPASAVAHRRRLRAARDPLARGRARRGLRSDDGLGMLARQGALALELWLGVTAPARRDAAR